MNSGGEGGGRRKVKVQVIETGSVAMTLVVGLIGKETIDVVTPEKGGVVP